MSRSEDDTWDIASGVGLTAVTIAASRAAETTSRTPLIRDHYANVLLAGDELRSLTAGLADPGGGSADGIVVPQPLVDYHAARTRFFDDYFALAAAAGIRQHVILAAGLDARAFRLAWPSGCRVFEIDQPLVLDFKARTLRGGGATPRAEWIRVGTDLRSQWDCDLRSAGFDLDRPTAWLAEGLLPFLDAAAQDSLFDRILTLSAGGSQIALEAFNVNGGSLMDMIGNHLAELPHASMQDLWYGDEGRSNPVAWWRTQGWQVDHLDAADYLASVDRPIADGDSFSRLSTFVVARSMR